MSESFVKRWVKEAFGAGLVGKVTVPKRLRELFDVKDEDYVRLALVEVLKRNISLEGFNAEGFEENFNWFGKLACWHCVVPEAVWLRDHIKKLKEAIRRNEEEMREVHLLGVYWSGAKTAIMV